MEVTSTLVGTQLVVRCPDKFNSEAATLVVKEVASNIEVPASVVLNFKNTSQVETLVLLRCIGSLGKFLRSKQKGFFLTNASPEISTEIRINGLDSTIRFISESAITTAPIPKPKQGLNVEFINPFIDATIKTLQTQCNMELSMKDKPFLKGTQDLPAIEIAGIIGLTSAAFKGSISICFPRDTFLKIMGGMLGEAYTEITDDLQDGAGELLNIIFGQSKAVLNEKGFGIEKAIPTVVRAKELTVRQYSNAPVVVMLFTSSNGEFFVEIALES
jgi:chemotaxis protein CheX